MTACW